MRFVVASIAAVMVVMASVALAVDYKPYPNEKITESQWVEYFAQVKASFGASMQELHDQHLVIFRDDATTTSYAFTTPDHPAHPAWITRRIAQESGQLFVDQIGYFAGKEAPFALLFQQYQATNQKMMDAMRRQKSGN